MLRTGVSHLLVSALTGDCLPSAAAVARGYGSCWKPEDGTLALCKQMHTHELLDKGISEDLHDLKGQRCFKDVPEKVRNCLDPFSKQ